MNATCAVCGSGVQNERRNGGVPLCGARCDGIWFDGLWLSQKLELPRCCEHWDIDSFHGDGLGGGYEIEWCRRCGSLRHQSWSDKARRKVFGDWEHPEGVE